VWSLPANLRTCPRFHRVAGEVAVPCCRRSHLLETTAIQQSVRFASTIKLSLVICRVQRLFAGLVTARHQGFVWAAPAKSGHIEPSSLKKQHATALRVCKVRPFVLYSLRHTFLTRLGQSGCDVWTLARIAGHSSIAISARYVHPSEDAVLDTMARLGGHNSGHSAKLASREEDGEPALIAGCA
jgi:hypothetical protein